jgi:hypothetical protein
MTTSSQARTTSRFRRINGGRDAPPSRSTPHRVRVERRIARGGDLNAFNVTEYGESQRAPCVLAVVNNVRAIRADGRRNDPRVDPWQSRRCGPPAATSSGNDSAWTSNTGHGTRAPRNICNAYWLLYAFLFRCSRYVQRSGRGCRSVHRARGPPRPARPRSIPPSGLERWLALVLVFSTAPRSLRSPEGLLVTGALALGAMFWRTGAAVVGQSPRRARAHRRCCRPRRDPLGCRALSGLRALGLALARIRFRRPRALPACAPRSPPRCSTPFAAARHARAPDRTPAPRVCCHPCRALGGLQAIGL